MIFKGKIATWWYIVIAVLNGVAIASLIYQIWSGNLSLAFILNLAVFLLFDLYFVPVLFKNEVTVTKKLVTIKFGLLTKEIPIQDIRCVKKMKVYSASFAASFERIGIESYSLTDVYVSLEDNEAFVKELMRKNRKIKYLI